MIPSGEKKLFRPVVLRPERVPHSPGGLAKTQMAGPHPGRFSGFGVGPENLNF